MRLQKKLVAGAMLAVAAVIAAPAVASAAPAAPANSQWDFTVSGVIIWSGVSSSTTHLGLGYPGQGFTQTGQVKGTVYTPCGSNLWLYGHDDATGVQGYVPICRLTQ